MDIFLFEKQTGFIFNKAKYFELLEMASTVTMRAKYKSAVKDPGIPGVLVMTEDKIVFTSNDRRSTMNEEFRNIKGHKFSKEGSKQALLNLTQDPEKGGGYIFEFEKFQDRDTCRDFVGKTLGKIQSAAASGHGANSVSERSAVAVQDEQLSAEEMEHRMKLLRDNMLVIQQTCIFRRLLCDIWICELELLALQLSYLFHLPCNA
ncbi:putative RNA polymerase II transcription factor B subunit 1-1 [Nymphaea thermarum]|nr:putative RNA polymerase II transcription factor B subunit 1-1 [Nymphaea thermarum]